MGDFSGSESSWKKMVIAKTNNKWVSTIQSNQTYDGNMMNTEHFSLEEEHIPIENIKRELGDDSGVDIHTHSIGLEPGEMIQEVNPLMIESPLKRRRRKESGPRSETPEERAARLAKMSAYAAQRLANETPEQRAMRLRRMSEYAAKRLAQETNEQRAKRLARMSAYAAKRLAKETPEQRQARLARMSAYAARRQAMKKNATSGISDSFDPHNTSFTMNNILPNQS